MPSTPKSLVPVRKRMEEIGVQPGQIGWDHDRGIVTVGGQDIITPTTTIDGRSYAPEQQLVSALQEAGINIQTGPPETQFEAPYQDEIEQLVSELIGGYEAPQFTAEDITQTPEYQSMQQIIQQQTGRAQQQAMEELAGRGILPSTIAADRTAQIQQAGAEQMGAQVAPQVAEQLRGQHQQQFQNVGHVIQQLTGMGQQEFDRLMGEAGLTGMYGGEPTMAREFREAELTGMYGGEPTMARQFGEAEFTGMYGGEPTLQAQQLELQEDMANLERALNRVMTMGKVTTQEDADLLGVPVGTPSFQAREAAADRQLQIRLNNARISASRGSDNVRNLLAIWERSGEAPPGLEAYGVAPGTPLAGAEQSYQNILAEAHAQAEYEDFKEDQLIQGQVPMVQNRYGVDSSTAFAAVSAIFTGTESAALADLEGEHARLRERGVNVPKAKEIVKDHYRTDLPTRAGGHEVTPTQTPQERPLWQTYMGP